MRFNMLTPKTAIQGYAVLLFALLSSTNVYSQTLPPGDSVLPRSGDLVYAPEPDSELSCHQNVWVYQNLGESKQKTNKNGVCERLSSLIQGVGYAESRLTTNSSSPTPENSTILLKNAAVSNNEPSTGHGNGNSSLRFYVNIEGLPEGDQAYAVLNYSTWDAFDYDIRDPRTTIFSASMDRDVRLFQGGEYIAHSFDTHHHYVGSAYASKIHPEGLTSTLTYNFESSRGHDISGDLPINSLGLYVNGYSARITSEPEFCDSSFLHEEEFIRLLGYVAKMWTSNGRKIHERVIHSDEERRDAEQDIQEYADYVSSQPWIKNRGLTICPKTTLNLYRAFELPIVLKNGKARIDMAQYASARGNIHARVNIIGQLTFKSMSIRAGSDYIQYPDLSITLTDR
jgi:hypothetical protein